MSEGFVEIARRPNYYQPDGVDAIVMRLDLRGWLAEHSGMDVVGSASEIRSESASENPDAPTPAESPTLDRVPTAVSEAGACT
ncbi:Acetyltransferase (fragment) [Microbacterium sp. C448]